MAFRFSLETLLRFRINCERRERLVLEALASQITQVLGQIASEDQLTLAARHQVAERLGRGMTGWELAWETEVANVRKRIRLQLLELLAQLEEKHHAQQETYRRARQKREILEKFRERKLLLYRQEQTRREQQALDEIFLLRKGMHAENR
jgi:flagellar export protein FliJ